MYQMKYLSPCCCYSFPLRIFICPLLIDLARKAEVLQCHLCYSVSTKLWESVQSFSEAEKSQETGRGLKECIAESQIISAFEGVQYLQCPCFMKHVNSWSKQIAEQSLKNTSCTLLVFPIHHVVFKQKLRRCTLEIPDGIISPIVVSFALWCSS